MLYKISNRKTGLYKIIKSTDYEVNDFERIFNFYNFNFVYKIEEIS